jgi:predicted DNA-binding transcriptional regulator AlpA
VRHHGRVTPPPALDLIGITTVAAMFGVSRRTAEWWRDEGQLPDPDVVVGRAVAWHRATVHEWAKDTGRKILSPYNLKRPKMPRELPTIRGIDYIAERCGVTPKTVYVWRDRPTVDLPEPDLRVPPDAAKSMSLGWYAETIDPWIDAYLQRRAPAVEIVEPEAVSA